ncbi:hypothetical protein ACFFX0_26205 [Citricoccus parietis]|uniref:Uncharacterized protein n=1 Tax=Citricoccus parietis TaxID=592307 RepID=A0ABV5G6B0_9MICC
MVDVRCRPGRKAGYQPHRPSIHRSTPRSPSRVLSNVPVPEGRPLLRGPLHPDGYRGGPDQPVAGLPHRADQRAGPPEHLRRLGVG